MYRVRVPEAERRRRNKNVQARVIGIEFRVVRIRVPKACEKVEHSEQVALNIKGIVKVTRRSNPYNKSEITHGSNPWKLIV
jgi:hypothetical protein